MTVKTIDSLHLDSHSVEGILPNFHPYFLVGQFLSCTMGTALLSAHAQSHQRYLFALHIARNGSQCLISMVISLCILFLVQPRVTWNKIPLKMDVLGQVMVTCRYSMEFVMDQCEWEFSNMHEQEKKQSTKCNC